MCTLVLVSVEARVIRSLELELEAAVSHLTLHWEEEYMLLTTGPSPTQEASGKKYF